MKLFPKLLCWVILTLLGVALTLTGIAVFTDSQVSVNLLLLAAMSALISFILIIFWCVSSCFNVYYSDSVILKRWKNIVYKTIPYFKIEGASLECAVYHPYNIPLRDQNKKKKAVLVLYESDISFVSEIGSNSCYPVNSFARINALCSDFFDLNSLKKLLNKTNISIYITEEVLLLYREELKVLLELYPQRFIVAFCDFADKTEKLSYDLFFVRRKDD